MNAKLPWFLCLALCLLHVAAGRQQLAAQEISAPGDVFAPSRASAPRSIRDELEKHSRSRSTSLELNDVRIAPGDLALLTGPAVNNITELMISSPDLTDADMLTLAKLPFTQLGLSSKKLSAAALKPLALERLEVLSFAGGACDDSVVDELRRFRGHTLGLVCPGLTDIGLARLDTSALKVLSLHSSAVTDKGIEVLRGTSLERLSLYKMKLTDTVLEPLLTLPRLAELDVRFVGVTEAGLAKFARARPSTRLILDAKEYVPPRTASVDLPRESRPLTSLPEGPLFTTVTYGASVEGFVGPGKRSFGPPLLGEMFRNGFDADALLPLPQQTSDVAIDQDRIIVLANGKLGMLDRKGNVLPSQMKTPPDLGWTRYFAFDAKNRLLYLPGKGLFRYDLARDTWTTLVTASGRLGYAQPITYCQSDNLLYSYRVEPDGQRSDTLSVLDGTGSEVRSLSIEPGLPASMGERSDIRIACTPQGLLLLVQYPASTTIVWRLFQIDVDRARVVEIGYDSSRDPAQNLWPGMKDGPIGITVPGSECGEGTATQKLSYVTPPELLTNQKERLYVVAIQGGVCAPDPNVRAEIDAALKQVAGAEARGGGLEAVRTLEALNRKQYSCPTKVRIPKLAHPTTVWLQSDSSGGWDLDVDRSTRISKLYVAGPDPAPVKGFGGAVERVSAPPKVPRGFRSTSQSVAFEPFITAVRSKTGLREHAYLNCPFATQVVIPESEMKPEANANER